jgi:thiamine kinase
MPSPCEPPAGAHEAAEKVVRALLAAHPATAALASAPLHPVPGGLSNLAWRAEAGVGSRFVRLARDALSGLGADHRNERRVLEVVSAAGLAPRVLHSENAAPVLVTEWIDAVEPPRPRNRAIDAVARTLARLHGLSARGELRSVDFAEQSRILQAALPASERQQGVHDVAEHVFAALRRRSARRALCHHDLNPLNLLFDRSGRLWVVDWEYAGLGDPVFDLASYASQHGLKAPERARLAASYAAAGGVGVNLAELEQAAWAFDYVQWLWYRAALDGTDTVTDRELAGTRTVRLATSLRGRARRVLRCNNASFADNETRV